MLPTEQGVGSSTIRLGIAHALEQHGYSTTNFHPFKDANISPAQLQNYFHQLDITGTFLLRLTWQRPQASEVYFLK